MTDPRVREAIDALTAAWEHERRLGPDNHLVARLGAAIAGLEQFEAEPAPTPVGEPKP